MPLLIPWIWSMESLRGSYSSWTRIWWWWAIKNFILLACRLLTPVLRGSWRHGQRMFLYTLVLTYGTFLLLLFEDQLSNTLTL